MLRRSSARQQVRRKCRHQSEQPYYCCVYLAKYAYVGFVVATQLHPSKRLKRFWEQKLGPLYVRFFGESSSLLFVANGLPPEATE